MLTQYTYARTNSLRHAAEMRNQQYAILYNEVIQSLHSLSKGMAFFARSKRVLNTRKRMQYICRFKDDDGNIMQPLYT